MVSDQDRRLEQIFADVAALPPARQEDKARSLCAGNSSLLTEVLALLACNWSEEDALQGGHPGQLKSGSSEASTADDTGDTQSALPATIDHFRVVNELGSGGFGTVYRAYDEAVRREVAIKVLESSRAEVLIEASAQASVKHEAVVLVHQVLENALVSIPGREPIRRPCIVMEYVPGETLATAIRAGGVTPTESARLLLRIAEAVGAAHSRGLLHRDLKPRNILLDDRGRPRVTDFGICISLHEMEAGRIVGTPAYMAPEQIRGEPPDVRNDIWSMGVILYELLTGRHPFQTPAGLPLVELIGRITAGGIIAPRTVRNDVPEELEQICLRCLCVDPDARFRSAKMLAAELQDWRNRSMSESTDVGDVNHRSLPDDPKSSALQDRFETLIDRNTGGFLGRAAEIEQIREWVADNDSGIQLIIGGPGIGKTALMAALSWSGSNSFLKPLGDLTVAAQLRPELWPGWPDFRVISYFIIRGETTARPAVLLNNLIGQLNHHYRLNSASHGTVEELRSELQYQLQCISDRLMESGGTLLILIDGLDESVSAAGDAPEGEMLLRSIPRDLPPRVFLVMTSRPREEVTALQRELHRERSTGSTLSGLSRDSIRSLLRNGNGKLNLAEPFIDRIAHLSAGNPLYLRLLLNELRQQPSDQYDLQRLPQDLDAIFEGIVQRLVQPGTIDRLRTLLTFALAREQLTSEQVAGITGQTVLEAGEAIAACQEVLVQKRSLHGPPVYRSFHDSFSDFLRQRSDYAGLAGDVSLGILRHAAGYRRDSPADRDLEHFLDRLFYSRHLAAGDAPAASRLIERCSGQLTALHVIYQQFRRLDEPEEFLASLAGHPGTATARLTIQCLAANSSQQPEATREILASLMKSSTRRRDHQAVGPPFQAHRIALEVVAATCDQPEMQCSVRSVILAACSSSNSLLRSIAVVSVFQLVQRNYGVGMDVLEALAGRSVRFGFICPRRLEVFVGCAVGLFFTRPLDDRLAGDLQRLLKELIRRIRGLRLAMWGTPKLAALLWGFVPDDIVPINFAELKAYKRYIAKRPDRLARTLKMTESLDSDCRSTDTLIEDLQRYECTVESPVENVSFCITSQCWLNYTVAHDESVMESVFLWRHRLPAEHFLKQDFLFWIRCAQIGRRWNRQSPLAEHWFPRVESLIREFIVDQQCKTQGALRTYYLCGLPYGIAFLAHHQGHGRVAVLRELLEWAVSHDVEVISWLIHLIELLGVEFGLANPLCREAALYALQGLVECGAELDDRNTNRVAACLSRMRMFHADDVESFLVECAKFNADFVEELNVRIRSDFPRTNIATLLTNYESAVTVFFVGNACRRKQRLLSLREFMKEFLGPRSVSSTLRVGVQQLMKLVRE